VNVVLLMLDGKKIVHAIDSEYMVPLKP